MTRLAGLPRAALVIAALALFLLPGCQLFRGGKKPSPTAGERISVLDFEQQVQAEPELAGLAVLLPAEVVNDSWTQPGGTAAGVMGHLSLGPDLARVWSVRIGRGSDATRRLNGAPVVAANRLYAMDAEAVVSSFDAATGRLIWRVALEPGRDGGRPAFGGGVSVAGDTVLATTGLGHLVALDAATGAERWRRRVSTPLRGAPAVDDGRVFVTSQDSQLTAFDLATGAELWDANATVEPAAILGPGAPAVAAGTVVAGFPSGELFALRVENGRTVWQDQLARTGRTTALGALSGIAGSPVIDRGRVFAIGHGGRMASLDLASGQRVWEREFAGVETPWVAGDWVFVVTVDAQLVALTRLDGKIRWVTDLGRWRNEKRRTGAIEWAGPLLAGGRLILVSSRGEMVEVDPGSGAIGRRLKASGPAYLAPVVANRMLYVLADDGTLTAYR